MKNCYKAIALCALFSVSTYSMDLDFNPFYTKFRQAESPDWQNDFTFNDHSFHAYMHCNLALLLTGKNNLGLNLIEAISTAYSTDNSPTLQIPFKTRKRLCNLYTTYKEFVHFATMMQKLKKYFLCQDGKELINRLEFQMDIYELFSQSFANNIAELDSSEYVAQPGDYAAAWKNLS